MDATSFLNISKLIQAAELLERKDREHGYASSLPVYNESKRKARTKRLHSNSRSTHNELEKNRRAHLRHCFERLKEIVPVQTDAPRHTTLGLLTNAKTYIGVLQEKCQKFEGQKENLSREQRYLARRLEQLQNRIRGKQRQDSTGSSVPSDHDSEKDEIDIVGYNSDSDERGLGSDLSNSDGGQSVTLNRNHLPRHL
ncbi:Max-interacting protein 1 [Holothuria leucospilota]|uniref:Max-interacting protein 1 n=1 Tax=Holothuria leucospilota TaxID=206669 RepID=A0A9Q0YP67_HOLLE|nr:Max-interacting protein 1 [Holothuria leucospilota]